MSKCTKFPEQEPMCYNCGESHTAKYGGCPYLIFVNEQEAKIKYCKNTNDLVTFRRLSIS